MECAPTAAGATSIAATVTDASGAVAVGAALPFVVAPDPVVGRPTLATPAAGTDVGRWANLSIALLGAGAGGPYADAWSGLPDGCPAADAATLTCRPAAPGISSVSVTVTDANGLAIAALTVSRVGAMRRRRSDGGSAAGPAAAEPPKGPA